jgi:hypothetical protein
MACEGKMEKSKYTHKENESKKSGIVVQHVSAAQRFPANHSEATQIKRISRIQQRNCEVQNDADSETW